MAYTFSQIDMFRRQYCAYYHVLEADFLATEQYLSVDPDNYLAFSNEFTKLIQAICSEIDVVTKYLCSLLSPNFNRSTFPDYCKCILDSNSLFPRANVVIPKVQSIRLAPWFGWSYKEIQGKDGKKRVQADNPEWWTKYNKIKHSRTALDEQTGKEYYKFANQKNTLDALSALFILNSYILHFFCKDTDGENAKYFLNDWYNGSRFFSSFVVAGL